MEKMDFPQYRQSSNGLNWYRIESPTAFTEVQLVGSRYVVHHMETRLYPEKARVMALLSMDEGHVHACAAEEVERLLLLA